METRSNYVMVGAITMGLLVALLGFIIWLAGLSNKQTKCFDIYFGQAVGGLNKGSGVTFSGVPVGQVAKISLLSGENGSTFGSTSETKYLVARPRWPR